MANEAALYGVYGKLLAAYGKRGWWPTTRPDASKATYEPGRTRRLTASEKFEVCAGAILAQNTAWANAAKAIAQLREAGLLSASAMANATLSRVRQCVRPAGYYNQKAAYLRTFAKHVCKQYGGDVAAMLSQEQESLRGELLSLNGIGPETADSILVYAAGLPAFVADAYSRRIAGRLGAITPETSRSYEKTRAFFHKRLAGDARFFGEFHALLVEHAKRRCTKNAPACDSCPLLDECAFGRRRVK